MIGSWVRKKKKGKKCEEEESIRLENLLNVRIGDDMFPRFYEGMLDGCGCH